MYHHSLSFMYFWLCIQKGEMIQKSSPKMEAYTFVLGTWEILCLNIQIQEEKLSSPDKNW